MIRETPEAAATEYLTALRSSEWQRAAELVDPELIERFVQGVTIPTTSQYDAKPHPADPDDESAIPHLFSGVNTLAELASLDPRDAFARCLDVFSNVQTPEGGSGRVELRDLGRIAGTLHDGNLAHVVYYAAWTGMTPKPYVLTVRRSEAGWTVLPTVDPLERSPETVFDDPFRLNW
jgi:hypothetical protein